MNSLRRCLMKIPRTRWGRQTFLLKLSGKKVKLLDVGCGNNSPLYTKNLCKDVYYVGIDVGNYNNTEVSLNHADEYKLFSPDNFSDGIDSLEGKFDAVISNHNLEHCNKPEKTLRSICRKIRKKGKLYLAFPNSDSVNFPHRLGTLNFYDDPTHSWIPELDTVISILEEEGMVILKAVKGYRPVYYWLLGSVMERISRKQGKVKKGTWGYWGFESIIWAEKD